MTARAMNTSLAAHRPGWPINSPQAQIESVMARFASAAAEIVPGKQSQAVEALRRGLGAHLTPQQRHGFLLALRVALEKDAGQ